MIDIIEDIADHKVERNYQLDKPLGVRGRSSNNDKIKEVLVWEPQISLREGLTKTYNWIHNQLLTLIILTSSLNFNNFKKTVRSYDIHLR